MVVAVGVDWRVVYDEVVIWVVQSIVEHLQHVANSCCKRFQILHIWYTTQKDIKGAFAFPLPTSHINHIL